MPTLVIHGRSDAIVPLEHSGKCAAESIMGANVVGIKGRPPSVNTSHATRV